MTDRLQEPLEAWGVEQDQYGTWRTYRPDGTWTGRKFFTRWGARMDAKAHRKQDARRARRGREHV